MKNKNLYLILLLLISLFSCHSGKEISHHTQQTTPKINHNKLITVGVFNGNGAGEISVIETIEALKIDKGINAIEISASEISNGKLEQIDAIIFPGGSGSKQLNNLGKTGQQKIKKFIKNGKGAIGICAGAYMFCSTEGYPSLQIANVKHIDRAHYARGRGLIEFKLNEEGEKIFPEFKGHKQFIQYFDGPIMETLSNNKNLTQLAVYTSDIHINKGTPIGVTPHKLFIYYQKIGKGTIFAIGGHAESTPGIRWMIPRMARFVTGKKLVSYPKKWIHPEKNTKEIFFVSDLKKEEKKNWWLLLSKDAEKQISALTKLYDMRSRPAVRWSVGLLRDSNPKVRAYAAKIIQKTEWTHALPDLLAAYKIENNANTKKIIKEVIDFFTIN